MDDPERRVLGRWTESDMREGEMPQLMNTGFRLIEASRVRWVALFQETMWAQRLFTNGQPLSTFLPEGGC